MESSTPWNKRWTIFALLVVAIIAVGVQKLPFTPASYSPPERTNWAPIGPRSLPYIGDASDPAGGDVLGNPVSYFRTLHSDAINSDEVAIVTAPVLESDWIAEPHTFNPEGPSFDADGNLYFSPLFSPGEDVVLISLDPSDGSRRWTIEGIPGGTGTPLILDDPATPGEQIIYVGSYDRAMALKPGADTNLNRIVEPGEMIWEVATGLSATPGDRAPHIFGINYDPTTDALIGLARDNHIYVLDRKTGRSLLHEPYSLPDIAPSPARPAELPRFLRKRLEEAVRPIMGEMSFESFVGALLGNTSMIANYFSVDPHSGKIWVAATAPDAEDGNVDGVSEFGALYCLRLMPAEGGIYRLEVLFDISFEGGSASTPALSADGKRVYIGDNFGKLLAIDASDGSTVWEFDVGEQIVGSVSVASDNRELYLPTATTVVKLIDHGPSATRSWQGTFDMYPQIAGVTENRRSLTATITANGIAVMGASEALLGPGLTLATGVGLLDRETGKLRYFVEGREDSVAVTALGPDGSVYIAHSPVKRLFASALLGGMVPSITGGIQKYSPKRFDLLIRDAVHAAGGRAKNVAVNGASWEGELKALEVKQINLLINQSKAASVKAITNGDLTAIEWDVIEEHISEAESALSARDFAGAHRALQIADGLL